MESLRELYRIGLGPSSSHTMGPRKAALDFLSKTENAVSYFCELYGSLAATGKGHLTDRAIKDVFKGKKIEISWKPDTIKKLHPNALMFKAYDKSKKKIATQTYYSVGGGKIVTEENFTEKIKDVYPASVSTMGKILAYCDREGMQLWEVAVKFEGKQILDYMDEVWTAMQTSINNGLLAEGVLQGGLKIPRKAGSYNTKAVDFAGPMGNTAKAISFALAVAEENAAGGTVVSAPTCGSSGIVPGVLYYLQQTYKIPKVKILRALLVAGIVGNVIKTNGSISGAEVGCQGEVGSACAMAGAAATYLLGGSIYQIEYAAEMGLEHHLGLTCDPLMGLVQIPCIERNAMATMRALDHATYALLSDGRHKISFDNIISVMMETGNALPYLFKETSKGGIASLGTGRSARRSTDRKK